MGAKVETEAIWTGTQAAVPPSPLRRSHWLLMIAADGVPPPPKLKKKGRFGANTEREGMLAPWTLDKTLDFIPCQTLAAMETVKVT